MRRAPIVLVLVATLGFCFFSSPNASALGPIDVEVAAKVGYGLSPLSNLPANPLGFGVGGRAGISVFNVYVGGTGIYYLGGSTETSLLYGGELGYSIKVLIVTIRPQVGVGNYVLHTDFGGVSSNAHNLYLEPGVTGLVKLGTWLLGADANVLVLPGMTGNQAAFTAHGQIGIQF